MKIARSAACIGRLFGRMPGALPSLHGLALSSLVALAAWSPAAQAVVVVSPAANLAVPVTTAGIYINVVTGVSSAAPASAVGWDINPWGTGSAFLYSASTGGVVTSALSTAAGLTLGTVVGPSSTTVTNGVASFGAGAGQWTLNATNYFGFKFIGEDALLHYGYGTMIVGATALTRTVGQLFYESAADTAITVSAVPEPSTTAMLLAGGALGAFMLRRRRQATI